MCVCVCVGGGGVCVGGGVSDHKLARKSYRYTHNGNNRHIIDHKEYLGRELEQHVQNFIIC